MWLTSWLIDVVVVVHLSHTSLCGYQGTISCETRSPRECFPCGRESRNSCRVFERRSSQNIYVLRGHLRIKGHYKKTEKIWQMDANKSRIKDANQLRERCWQLEGNDDIRLHRKVLVRTPGEISSMKVFALTTDEFFQFHVIQTFVSLGSFRPVDLYCPFLVNFHLSVSFFK